MGEIMKKNLFLSLLTAFLLGNGFLLAQSGSALIMKNKSWDARDEEIVQTYKSEGPWGMSVSIDLHSADPKMLRSEKIVTQFIKDLVVFIKMKAYGEPIVRNFGDNPRVAGISALQLIETSSITAHFANNTNSIHIDIFSCSAFRPHAAALWCKDYFKAVELQVSPAIFRF